MESSSSRNKQPCNNDREKKMVVKIGGRSSSSGIGAVILFGGALAATALASAFIVGKRSSKNNIYRNPPPPPCKSNEPIIDAHKPTSCGATDDVVLEKGAATSELVSGLSLILDEKPGIEVNGGGTAGDQSLCSISSLKQENDTNGSAIVEEKFDSFEPTSMMHEVQTQLTGEQVTNEISTERDEFKEIYIDKEITDGEYMGDGEIKEMSREEAVNIAKMQSIIGEAIHECCDQEGSELAVVDKVLENGHIDEMETEMTLQIEVIKDVKEVDAIHGDNEVIMKCDEEAIEIKKLDVAAIGDGEVKVLMSHIEAAEIKGVQPSGEENTEECCDQDEVQVTVTENSLKGVHIDQVEAGENLTMEVNNEVKPLEIYQNEAGEMDEGKCQETIEEVLESSEERKYGNQEAFQDGQATVEPVVETPVIEHRNVDGDEEEEFTSTEVAEKSDEGISSNDEAILSHSTVAESESHKEETLLSVYDSPLVEHDNKEVVLPTQIVEIIQDGHITEGLQEIQVSHTEEQRVDEKKEHDQADEEFFPESCEEVGLRDEAYHSFLQCDQKVEVNEEKIPCGDNEENEEVKDEPMLIEELISDEKVETEEDAASEEVAKSLEVNENEPSFSVCQQKIHNCDLEENIKVETDDSPMLVDTNIAEAAEAASMETIEDEEKGEEGDAKTYGNETDLSDEREDSSTGTGDSSTESNSEAVWPAELLQEPSMETQQAKPISQENTSIEEDNDSKDKAVADSLYQLNQLEATEDDLRESTASFTVTADSEGDLNKTRYQVEAASLKNHMTNSTRWRILIATLSTVSSLSCSWFFGLSFVKLCLIVFLTMVLSKFHGY